MLNVCNKNVIIVKKNKVALYFRVSECFNNYEQINKDFMQVNVVKKVTFDIKRKKKAQLDLSRLENGTINYHVN